MADIGKEDLYTLEHARLREAFCIIGLLQSTQLKRYNKRASIDANKKAVDFKQVF